MDTKRTNPRKDFSQVAHSVFQKAIGETPQEPDIDPKKKAAIESGRKGGIKGGKARAGSLTSEQRADIARIAAQARWKKKD